MSMKYSVILEMIDKMTAPLKSMTAGVHSLSTELAAVQNKAGGMARVNSALHTTQQKIGAVLATAGKISAVTGLGMGGIAASATNISAKYEDLGAVLETLEGSSDKAQTSLAWIKDFTKTTPYELSNTAEAFARLRAYGIDPMDGTMRTLGDTSAAMGKDIMAAVDMMADAVVGENERLKEFGIRGSVIKGTDNLEYSYKDKSGQQKTAMVNKNDQDEIKRTLSAIFNEKYAGSMEKRSKTFNGILSNMKDTVAGLQSQFMSAGLFDAMKGSLQNKLDLLSKLSESGAVERWGAAAANAATTVSNALSSVGSGIASAHQRLSGFVGGWGNLGRALGLVKQSTSSVTQLFSVGMPDWLKPSGNQNTAMSPVLDQLRTIEKGDTLWNIAKQTSGIGAKYKEIAALNSDIIKDADKIFPGQQIRIPKLSGLPDWVKARKAGGEMSPVQQSAPTAAPAAQNIVAIAELAKTNKVIAAAVLLRKTWDAAFAGISASFARAKSLLSSGFEHIANYAIANSDKIAAVWQQVTDKIGEQFTRAKVVVSSAMLQISNWVTTHSETIKTALHLMGGVALSAFTRWPSIAIGSLKWLSGAWTQSFDQMKDKLPVFKVQAGDVFNAVSKWAEDNSGKIKKAFSGVMTKALERFGKAMDWLSEKANDGSIGKWLDEALEKVQPFIDKVLDFGKGILKAGKWVAGFVERLAEFTGGWENLGKIFAGLAILTILGPVISALAATAALVLTLGQIAWATGAAFMMLARSTMVANIATRIWQATMIVVRALSLVGMLAAMATSMGVAAAATWILNGAMAVLTSPILLVVAAIAAVVAILWNWDSVSKQLVAWWNGSELKKWLPSVITDSIDTAIAKITEFKNWWDNTTFSQKVASVSTKVSSFVEEAGKNMFGGNRALGGAVEAGKMYRVNEYGDELIERGNKMFLMSSGAGKVIPFPDMPNMRQETPFAAPAGVQTVPQRAAAMAANAPSRSEVDVRIISDKPVQVERMRSDRNTALTVDTGRMMTSP